MTAAVATIAVRPAKIGGDEAVRLRGHESQKSPLRHGHTMTEGNSGMLEKSSARQENYAEHMREFLLDAGGSRQHGESRERWLERAARRCGLSYRRAKSFYYRETKRVEIGEYDRAKQAAHVAKLREIAELRARLDRLEKDVAPKTSTPAPEDSRALGEVAHGQS